MGRTLNTVIAALPAERQAKVHARHEELRREVEGLRELRTLAGKAQSDVARALKIAQPSVSQMEKQSDMYLSTLRDYVEAMGGHLDLVVRLPDQPAVHLHTLGDLAAAAPSRARKVVRRREMIPA